MYLGEIAQIFSGRPVRRVPDGDAWRSARVVGLRDVGRRISPAAEIEEVQVAETDDVARSALQVGDIVVTARGANVRAAVATSDHEGLLAGPNLIVVRLGGGAPPEMIAAYLRHPEVSARLLRDFVGTSTGGITIESLRRVELAMTDSDCAARLSELVQRIDAYAEYQRRVIDLRQTAADEAIFGHLHPRDRDGPE
jgi:hypothetical protein